MNIAVICRTKAEFSDYINDKDYFRATQREKVFWHIRSTKDLEGRKFGELVLICKDNMPFEFEELLKEARKRLI